MNREDEDRWIVTFVSDALAKEEDARRDREEFWRDGYDLLMNRYSFKGKEDWQSKLVISKVPNAIQAATAILKAGVTQTRDWFDLEVVGGVEDAMLADLKDLVRAEIEERDPHTHMDFLDVWCLGVKNALATAPLILKVYAREIDEPVVIFEASPEAQEATEAPEESPMAAMQRLSLGGEQGAAGPLAQAVQTGQPLLLSARMEKRRRVKVCKDLVDPFDFYADTMGGHLYEMQKIRGDLDDLNGMTEQSGYRQEAIRRVKGKIAEKKTEEEDEQSDRTDERGQPARHRKRWSGVEYWGSLPGDDGELIFRNHVITVIEDEVVRVAPNPNPDGSPFRWSTIEPLPFSTYGRGFIENSLGLARAMIELSNAILDAVMFEVLKAFEIDIDQVNDPLELSKPLYPGRLIPKSSSATPSRSGQAIQAIDTGRSPSDALGIYGSLDRAFQEATSVTDLTLGVQPTRAAPTATEVADRRSSTNVIFRGLAQWLEKSSLEPALQAVFHRMVQYRIFGPGGEAWVKRVLGAERAEAFKQRVIQALVQTNGRLEMDVRFKVVALTSIAARAVELERLMHLTETMKGFPGVANRLNLDEYVRRILHVLGYDSSTLLKTKEQLEQVGQLEQMVLSRLAQGAGEQPRSNSGLSAVSGATVAPGGA